MCIYLPSKSVLHCFFYRYREINGKWPCPVQNREPTCLCTRFLSTGTLPFLLPAPCVCLGWVSRKQMVSGPERICDEPFYVIWTPVVCLLRNSNLFSTTFDKFSNKNFVCVTAALPDVAYDIHPRSFIPCSRIILIGTTSRRIDYERLA